MSKRNKILKFLIKPPMWMCITVWAAGVASLVGSITLYYLGMGLKMWALPVYLVAVVFGVLSVYAVLTVVGVPERVKDKPKVREFFRSYNTRAFVYATCSVIFNLLYVAFGILIAVLEHSEWLGALVGYHIFLVLPRVEVLVTARLHGRKDDRNAEERQLRAYSNCGIVLVMLALAIIPVIRLTINDDNSYNYFIGAVAYVTGIAAYTFIKMGIAVYNMKKVRKQDDMSLIAVKNISFSDALISLFALQAMMFKELNAKKNMFVKVMNPLLGGVIVAAILAIGLYMLIGGYKRLKAMPEANDGADKVHDGQS
ncbi:MAG: hypothetical protein J1G01_00940 [Clostridiales bacterium]|nr:hypothetical protein [Clostridiales bacterium]